MKEHKHSVLAILFWFGIIGVEPLRDVKIIVPSAVNLGNHVTLTCLFDLDYNESLYTVKWYLNGDEFYRYIPKEVPPIQIFPIFGMDVNTAKSDEHKVLLRSVHHEQSGVYKCEVSADAPFFDTKIESAQVTVVEFPENVPLIQVGKYKYEVGERIWANCSFGPSRPPANITWFINSLQVKDQFVKDFPHFEDGNKGLWVKSSVGMDTDVTSFRGGKLKLKCVADIFSVYSRDAEVQLEEEKPRSASVLGPKNSSKSSSILNSAGHPNSGINAYASSGRSSLSTFFTAPLPVAALLPFRLRRALPIYLIAWIIITAYCASVSTCIIETFFPVTLR